MDFSVNYTEASIQFSGVLEFLRSKNEIKASYVSALSAVRNALDVKAKFEQSGKGKK
jgi:hypothetical protein